MTWHMMPGLVWALQTISKHFNCNNCHWQQLFSGRQLISISRGNLKREEHPSCLFKISTKTAARQCDKYLASLGRSSGEIWRSWGHIRRHLKPPPSPATPKAELEGVMNHAASPEPAGQAAFGRRGCKTPIGWCPCKIFHVIAAAEMQ